MSVATRLVDLAHRSPESFGVRALSLLMGELEAEVGVFAAVGAAPLVTGLPPELARHLGARFESYAAEVAPVHAVSLAEGAATDLGVLGARWRETRVYREVVAPAGGIESLFLTTALGARKLGFVMLGRTRRRFDARAVAHAASVSPFLAVGCAAAGSPPPNLGATEADLLAYLELGYSTREIALARGTSFFTVRNQLSALYRRLGVANRTEAVGLARRG